MSKKRPIVEFGIYTLVGRIFIRRAGREQRNYDVTDSRKARFMRAAHTTIDSPGWYLDEPPQRMGL